MIQLPFREHHLLCLLEAYEQEALPFDLAINHYFRAHPALGSKDRGEIAETAYALMRWQGLLDYLNDNDSSWEKRYELYKTISVLDQMERVDIPLHIKCSFPKFLFDLLSDNYGVDAAIAICRSSNQPAPTTIRVNLLKTTRQAMLDHWGTTYSVSPCPFSEVGIIFHKRINFFTLPEFKEGLFEVQDEGSQLIARLIKAEPGQQILDYCAGSGGKTLAFAPAMNNTGQIFLHDTRISALHECRKRLKRAGIQNAQIVSSDDPKLKKLKKRMNWVLVDAPCTGTGTLRRNPDMKWKFSEEMLLRLKGQQRTIFEKALSFMHPEGRIVYATCSILKEENQVQAEHFAITYNLEVEGDLFHTLPIDGGMDGFFGVVFKRKT